MSTPWLADHATSPGPWPVGAWQRSSNSGGSYVAYNGANVAQVVGPVGTQRYRAQVVIPPGADGDWNFTAQGDLWQAAANQWQIRYDGVLMGSFTGYTFGTVALPVVPGPHTIEIWVGASSSTAGSTQLRVASSTFAQTPEPDAPINLCDCCPTGLSRCWAHPTTEMLGNRSFETPAIPVNSFASQPIPPWATDSGTNSAEIWHTPFTGGVVGLLPYPDGNQIIEVDTLARTLTQTFTVPAEAGIIKWSYLVHRRNLANSGRLIIGDATQPIASNTVVDAFVPPNDQWHLREGDWGKPAGVTQVRYRYELVGPFAATGILVDNFSAVFEMNPIPAFAMLCDGDVQWVDQQGVPVDETLVSDCADTRVDLGLNPVNVTYLAHPDDWPVNLTGARRNKWNQTAPQPTGGNVLQAGTCRDPQNRVVKGPCVGNPGPNAGNWVAQVNDVGVPNFSWSDGSTQVWGTVEGWLIVPLANNPVNIVASATAGNASRRLETGTSPVDRVLQPGNAALQALDTSCACLGALGFGVAYGRALAADGYFQGSVALSYDIGSGVVLVPRNRSVPSDANNQVPTDPRNFCADILPQFYVTVSAWQDPTTLQLFQQDQVTPLIINGSCQVVTSA